MEKEHSHMNERILNLTLEIIYLLTGEDYTVVKKASDKHLAPNNPLTVSRQSNKRQIYNEDPPPFLLMPLKNNKEILEVTQKIIELLAGEVSLRCQDVSVYFSMEEWEYLERHKELYKDVMMEDQPPLTSPDVSSNRNTPERCPVSLYPQDSTGEDNKIPQETTDLSHNITYHYQGDNLIVIKVEDEEEKMRNDEPCKEEEIPPEISADGRYRDYECHIVTVDEETEDDDIICDSPIENHVSNFLPPHPSEDFLSNLSTDDVCIIDDLDTVVYSTSPQIEKIYPCTQCGKCFTQSSKLVLHQRIHARTKPYGCSACGKSFTQRSHLFTHLRVHTGEKPFSCPVCGKCFRDKANLLRHGRIHKEDKPYSCHVCGRCFKDKSNLSKHLRIHTGEKPYACFECGKCFTRKSHLISHQRCHLGAKSSSGSA